MAQETLDIEIRAVSKTWLKRSILDIKYGKSPSEMQILHGLYFGIYFICPSINIPKYLIALISSNVMKYSLVCYKFSMTIY
jgi:hypothetical protein